MSVFFDGHNDVLLRLNGLKSGEVIAAFTQAGRGHIDLAKAKAGGLGGGLFAIYIPSNWDADGLFEAMKQPAYDIALPAEIPQQQALPIAIAQAAILLRLQAEGLLTICTTVDAIKTCLATGQMAAVMHMEGAEAIDKDFQALDVLYASGLRSLGPVWSRPTAFGHGVPFRYPSDGDIGPGLTALGKALVRHCNDRRILIDLSHLNEAGFNDVAAISDAPLVASHSNAHALCAQSRNLTDRQLAMIKESDGLVGVNFAVAFLREDGQMRGDTPLSVILNHLDYLIEHLGEDRVGFGSDFDGAEVPQAIGDASGLVNLRQAMLTHGYDAALMEKLCHGNWLRVLAKTWGA